MAISRQILEMQTIAMLHINSRVEGEYKSVFSSFTEGLGSRSSRPFELPLFRKFIYRPILGP